MRRKPQDILQRNSRDLKFDLRVSLPSEAENVLHRAFPTYRWVKGHTLDFFSPIDTTPSIFQLSVRDHLKSFGTDTFVFKTTLSPLRVSHLLQSFPDVEWHFIHLFRHPEEVAVSMVENEFFFQSKGRPMGHVEAWKFMVSNILAGIPETSLHVSYEQLWRDPASVVSLIFEAVNEPLPSSNGVSRLSGASFTTAQRNQPKPIALHQIRELVQ